MAPVNELAERIDDLLPQTQCRRCGYAGCRPYAEAIVAGDADINRCPPGGDTTIAALATLLSRNAPPLDTTCGTPGPLRIAKIDEPSCIGCTLCVAACPVDAIIGAQKRMHAILVSLCSGCELCIPACPVDCISMVSTGREWTRADAVDARLRHAKRQARIAKERDRETTVIEADAQTPDAHAATRSDAAAAAMARARERRAAWRSPR
ncbi:MAG TPA: RnfABCDGE type electron transport complex subunit B [Casimicrobiaceae bacterium]|nr:RnfABCDGE type electron transport complex subunit B [Casimicrobiaceae bacterium]